MRILTGEEDFDGLTQTVATLPGAAYWDDGWYKRELDQIFYTSWLYLCHASSLSEPRAFRSFTIGTQGIFLVRDEDGTLRGFHNSCRHRGARLLEGEVICRATSCPFHRWTYRPGRVLGRGPTYGENKGL